MSKRKRPRTRQDSPVLNQLAKLIDARLPDQHGFALLTFPLGAAVDPTVRYVGKGERADIIATMEAWCEHQRQHGWGHDLTPPETQWTTHRPTRPGYYVLKYIKAGAPELVQLVDEEGELQIYHWAGMTYEKSTAGLRDLDPADFVWLGPVPEPWAAPENAEPTDHPSNHGKE